jgi:hypothetical protein
VTFDADIIVKVNGVGAFISIAFSSFVIVACVCGKVVRSEVLVFNYDFY